MWERLMVDRTAQDKRSIDRKRELHCFFQDACVPVVSRFDEVRWVFEDESSREAGSQRQRVPI
jgi:hypothetical protein